MATQIVLQLGSAERALKTLGGQLTHTGPAMSQIRDVLIQTVQANFAAGGRPRRWAPLKAGRGAPLVRSHILTTLASHVTATSAVVSSDQPYSRLFQYGGTMHLPAMQAAPGRVFRWQDRQGRTVFARTVKAREAKVPARPYLVLQRQDYGAIYRILEAHLMQGQER